VNIQRLRVENSKSLLELLVKLLLYSALYGFVGINFIDLKIQRPFFQGYHLWLVCQYFAPFIPLLFVIGFQEWELVLGMGLLGSLLNDLGFYPAGLLLKIEVPMEEPTTLFEWYLYQLGFRGLYHTWYFEGLFFKIPVYSVLMGATIYLRVLITIWLFHRWWKTAEISYYAYKISEEIKDRLKTW
jgi:hypothetical protein